MPSQPPSDDGLVTLQARCILDLEDRVAELQGQIRERDAAIAGLEAAVAANTELIGVYQRSRAVRIGTVLKDLRSGLLATAGRGNGAAG